MIRFVLSLLLLSTAAYAEPNRCRAIDGDTYQCDGIRIRVENIDAPELHARCPSELDAANAAKRFAQAALDGAIKIDIRVYEKRPRDRYGRTLAHVLVDGDDLGELMIGAGLARPYHGERRLSWCD
jgi:endonuclease YncB( thermonuclease family)